MLIKINKKLLLLAILITLVLNLATVFFQLNPVFAVQQEKDPDQGQIVPPYPPNPTSVPEPACSGIYNPVLSKFVGCGPGNAIIGSLISRMIKMAMTLGVLTCFLYLILAGYEWMTAGGDKQRAEGAKNRITHAIVGLTIIASAYAIIIVIEKFLGITIFSGPIELPTP